MEIAEHGGSQVDRNRFSKCLEEVPFLTVLDTCEEHATDKPVEEISDSQSPRFPPPVIPERRGCEDFARSSVLPHFGALANLTLNRITDIASGKEHVSARIKRFVGEPSVSQPTSKDWEGDEKNPEDSLHPLVRQRTENVQSRFTVRRRARRHSTGRVHCVNSISSQDRADTFGYHDEKRSG